MNIKRKAIILAGGSGTRLFPITIAMSKQLIPIYDKPMIYYPLSVLMLAGIREILIITTPHDVQLFQNLLDDGSKFGISIKYAIQKKPEGIAQAFHIAEGVGFLRDEHTTLILGDNLFYGHDLIKTLHHANNRQAGATIFGYQVADPKSYGVVEAGPDGKIVSIEEKPIEPKSQYAVPGLYFYDNRVVDFSQHLKPSKRGEFEITDLNRLYLEDGTLHLDLMGRGTAWFDTGTHDSLLEAGQFVAVIEKRQGLKIACLEEIAFNHGWITPNALVQAINQHGKSSYGDYLRRLIPGAS